MMSSLAMLVVRRRRAPHAELAELPIRVADLAQELDRSLAAGDPNRILRTDPAQLASRPIRQKAGGEGLQRSSWPTARAADRSTGCAGRPGRGDALRACATRPRGPPARRRRACGCGSRRSPLSARRGCRSCPHTRCRALARVSTASPAHPAPSRPPRPTAWRPAHPALEHLRSPTHAARTVRRTARAFALMTIRADTQLVEELLMFVQHRREVRPLVRIDPDREHIDLLTHHRMGNAAAGKPEASRCPILFRATPQPSTGRRSVRSKANPHRRQGTLETTHRNPRPYEHPSVLAPPSSFRAFCAHIAVPRLAAHLVSRLTTLLGRSSFVEPIGGPTMLPPSMTQLTTQSVCDHVPIDPGLRFEEVLDTCHHGADIALDRSTRDEIEGFLTAEPRSGVRCSAGCVTPGHERYLNTAER